MASIGRATLQKEKLTIKDQLFSLERKLDFLNRYLNDNTEISIEEADRFISYLNHTDFDYETIKFQMMK